MGTRSPAVELVQLFWDNAHAKKASWKHINAQMQHALAHAVEYGFRFDLEDFDYINQYFKGQYWFGADTEYLYRRAVVSNNLSACRSYEEWLKRKPLYWNSSRLYVGANLTLEGETYEVTAITQVNGNHGIVACHYPPGWHRPRRPDSIKKLSFAEVRKLDKATKV